MWKGLLVVTNPQIIISQSAVALCYTERLCLSAHCFGFTLLFRFTLSAKEPDIPLGSVWRPLQLLNIGLHWCPGIQINHIFA